MTLEFSIFDLFETPIQFEVKDSTSTLQSKQGTTFINEEEFFRNSSVNYFRNSTLNRISISERENNDHFTGNQRLTSRYNFRQKDFEIISRLGNGAYGEVYKAKYKLSGETFSIKMIDKNIIERENKGYQVVVENEIINSCNHPNIIKIFGFYEDKDNFFLVEEYCPKGDLAEFLNQNHNLSLEETKFIIAQIVLCLEYLSSLHIIHRDIKPDNFVIDNNFRLKLIDFATATYKGKIFDEEGNKFLDEKKFLNANPNCISFNFTYQNKNTEFITVRNEGTNDRISNSSLSNSKSVITQQNECPFTKNIGSGVFKSSEIVKKQKFVGTAEYMPPEVINNQAIGEYTDIWSLVCIMFQIFTGKSPFRDKTEYLIFQNILQFKYNNENIQKIPKDAHDLIFSILKIKPSERFGFDKNKGYNFSLLKSHPFFKVRQNLNIQDIVKQLIKKTNYNKNKKKEDDIANAECIYDINNNNSANKDDSGHSSLSEGKSSEITFISDVDGAKIIKSGYLKKRSPYFYYDKRKIYLFDTPRIDYMDPETKELRGTIPLDKKCIVEQVKNNQFLLKTPKRTYSFMCKDNYDIIPWVTAIKEAIKTYAK